jgi:transposase
VRRYWQQQLVAARETVLDVPPTLSARVRLLDTTCTDKTDAHDAQAAAIVSLRHTRLRPVAAVDHAAVLGLRASTQRHVDDGSGRGGWVGTQGCNGPRWPL